MAAPDPNDLHAGLKVGDWVTGRASMLPESHHVMGRYGEVVSFGVDKAYVQFEDRTVPEGIHAKFLVAINRSFAVGD